MTLKLKVTKKSQKTWFKSIILDKMNAIWLTIKSNTKNHLSVAITTGSQAVNPSSLTTSSISFV